MLAGRDGARGTIRTCTGDALDVVSLLVRLRERESVEGGKAFRAVRGLSTINSQPSTKSGASHRCCPGTTFLQRKSAALLQGGVNGLPAVARRAKAGRSPQCCPGHSGHERHARCLDYTTGTEMVGAESAALSASRMSSERSAGELRPRIKMA